MHQVTSELQDSIAAIVGALRTQLSKIRTGRATPALVEGILVEAYNTKMEIRELATIRVPEPRQLLLEPWDPSVLGAMVQALC